METKEKMGEEKKKKEKRKQSKFIVMFSSKVF